MPRALKPYKVDFVRHDNGYQELEVFFDRDHKVFFAEIGMERVEHTDLVEAKKLAKELLTRAPKYEWEGVIHVSRITDVTDTHFQRFTVKDLRAGLDFSFQRVERARDPLDAERWFERQHTLDFEAEQAELLSKRNSYWEKPARVAMIKQARLDRDANHHLKRYYHPDRKGSDNDVVMPYSGERWAGLLAIKHHIEQLRAQLAAVVTRDDFVQRIATLAFQHPALPADRPKGRKLLPP